MDVLRFSLRQALDVTIFRKNKYRKIGLNVIAPLAPLFIYAYFIITNGTIQSTSYNGFFIHELVLRGFAGMCLGVSSFYIVRILKNKYKLNSGPILMLELLCYSSTILIMGISKKHYMGFYSVFLLCIGIICSFVKPSPTVGASKQLQALEKISYAIFLNHIMIRELMFSVWKIFFGFFSFLCYLLITTLSSFISAYLVQHINNIIVYSIKKIFIIKEY